MKDQVHIRNPEAAHLARTLARQTGKTISEVMLDALRQYQPREQQTEPAKQVEAWLALLHEDWRDGPVGQETPIEVLYDDETGLPA